MPAVAPFTLGEVPGHQVLKAIAQTIALVQAQEKQPSAVRATSFGLLAIVRYWRLKVDLGKQVKFPETVASTTLRSGMLLISETSKQIVLLELTVLWQESIEDTPDLKKAKYSELVEDSSRTGGEHGVSH